jgi:hypothetical protein
VTTATAPVIDNKVAAMFNAATAAMAGAAPDNGQGIQGEWPPEGDHDNFVLAMDLAPGTFKESNGHTVDCIEVQFEYELIPNTSDPKYDPSKTASRCSSNTS